MKDYQDRENLDNQHGDMGWMNYEIAQFPALATNGNIELALEMQIIVWNSGKLSWLIRLLMKTNMEGDQWHQ